MANIYLNSLKNQDKYIECYRVLLDKDPSTENYVRLAEAYLNIQDADQAVVTYERAKRSNPRAKFGVKLARIFVKTHQYEKAIQCYKEAADMEAMVELGGLYTKLGHLEVALECLEKVDRPTLTAPVLAKVGCSQAK
ncbi:tetratricopeptide repeat protein 21B-like [Diaphorina citri]|uniref:Tetratricopeptide repeat protein 21B-like n=2 Tax=Diaphorina citri TaxID=121845 RepID=A0A3Q0JHU3_DIACI|nr:tetratricopeptide repeat protein 21B-like [Diaphorina citri]